MRAGQQPPGEKGKNSAAKYSLDDYTLLGPITQHLPPNLRPSTSETEFLIQFRSHLLHSLRIVEHIPNPIFTVFVIERLSRP
jgi:hypothetical protein